MVGLQDVLEVMRMAEELMALSGRASGLYLLRLRSDQMSLLGGEQTPQNPIRYREEGSVNGKNGSHKGGLSRGCK